MPDAPTIKICGLRDAHTVQVAIDAGATALGFILAPSRRQVQPSDVRAILNELPANRPPAVGVVVNEGDEGLHRIMDQSAVDIVQLSGDEDPSILDGLDGAVWKVLRFDAATPLDVARRQVERWLDQPRPVRAIMIDAAIPGHYGGSGQLADWEIAAALAETYPIVLAGGLDPTNVAQAIRTIRPAGVDVSSGVESGGVKDPARIRDFISAALAAFAGIAVNPPAHRG